MKNWYKLTGPKRVPATYIQADSHFAAVQKFSDNGEPIVFEKISEDNKHEYRIGIWYFVVEQVDNPSD